MITLSFYLLFFFYIEESVEPRFLSEEMDEECFSPEIFEVILAFILLKRALRSDFEAG